MKKPSLPEMKLLSILCNPVYTGIGPYPKIIDDEDWIDVGKGIIKEWGLEIYLFCVFKCLELSFGENFPYERRWIIKAKWEIGEGRTTSFLTSLLNTLRDYYKKWRITSPIPVVIIQIYNILLTILYNRVCKSYIFGILNHTFFVTLIVMKSCIFGCILTQFKLGRPSNVFTGEDYE